MTWLTRVADYFGLRDEGSSMPAGVQPPSRAAAGATPSQAITLGNVYRAVSILAVSAKQLGIGVWRSGVELENPGSLVVKPNLDTHRPAFLELTVTSMALTGNAFWLHDLGPDGQVVNLTVLPAAQVAVIEDPRTRRISYSYEGRTYHGDRMTHLQLLRIPGSLYGLGPIGAAAAEFRGALDLRDYAANWFTDSGIPNGVLSTPQPLTDQQAKQYADRAKDLFDPTKPAVLGNGLQYEHTNIKPADAQYLESRKFTKTEIASIFGIPAKYMLAAVEGGADTYSNQEQVDIAFVRYTLMGYLREIEAALTALLPRGQEARFKIETLLRTDTKSRYEAHKIAIDMGLYDVTHAQRIEGLPAVPAAHTTTPKDTADAPANS